MRSLVLYVIVGAIIVMAFASGLIFSTETPRYTLFTTQTSTTVTQTTVMYVQVSGTNHSVFFVTEKVVVEPELINAVCMLQMTLTSYTTYYLPSEEINGSNPIGIVTTTTVNSVSTMTKYENATIISGSMTCLDINPHYNVSQSNTNCVCV